MSSDIQTTVAAEPETDAPTIREALIQPVHDSHRRRYWSEVDKETYVCPMCDRPEHRRFDVHHINRDWMDGRMVNLVGLCYPCHNRIHGLLGSMAGLSEWKQEFEALGGGGQ